MDTLQDVVEGLSETFVGINDALVKGGYVSRDREIATELRDGMERFLALSKVANQEKDDSDDDGENDDGEELGEQNIGEYLADTLASSSVSAPEGCAELRRILRQPPPTIQQVERGGHRTSQRGSFSPRLGYGVWSTSPDPSLPSRAMNNIIHYITAGHDSFAARLYWNSLTLGFRSLRGDENYPIDYAKSMFRYKLRYSSPQQVLTVIGHVLNQMLLGTSDVTFDESRNWEAFAAWRALPDPNNSGAVDTHAVKNAIHRDVIQEGGLVEDYLDTWGVERYLRDRWGVLVDSSTVRPVQRNLALNVEPLLNEIAGAAVTIGEGPRFQIQEIDVAVQSFLAESQFLESAAR